MSRATDDMRAASALPPIVGCDGKVRFESYQLAHSVVQRRARKKFRRQAYRCCHCGGWHLGTDPARRRLALRKQFEDARSRHDDEQ